MKHFFSKIKQYFVCELNTLVTIYHNEFPNPQKAPTWLLKIVMVILVVLRFFSLGQFVKGYIEDGKMKNAGIDLYVILMTVLLSICLSTIPLSTFAFYVAIYLMAEMFTVTLSVILVDSHFTEIGIRSPHRSILLLGLGYLELMMGFAILYMQYQAISFNTGVKGIVSCPIDALYFSTVTITTLGFGDISPCNRAGRCLVMIETLGGIILIVFVLSAFISSSKVLKKQSNT